MTILFVGAVSGVNVYFYATVADMLLFGTYIHAILFGVLTVGGIMIMKALFDLSLNDKIEIRLLDRQIENHFQRMQREEQIRNKLQENMRQFGTVRRESWKNNMIEEPTATFEDNTISNEFLATIQQ